MTNFIVNLTAITKHFTVNLTVNNQNTVHLTVNDAFCSKFNCKIMHFIFHLTVKLPG